MEIIIGSIPPIGDLPKKQQAKTTHFIDGQLLHVRPPRQGIAGPSGMERRNKKGTDPRTARILTIMIPDASQLPADLDTEKYEVSIRLVRR